MAKSLGRALKALRQKAGLQAGALARAAGISQAILTRLESGERKGVTFETACRLAQALGISLERLAAEAGLTNASNVVQADVAVHGARVAQAINSAKKRLEAASKDLDRGAAALRHRK